ncbi:DUF1934 family protein [Clostridium transplantifaecale]|uniref:DUF1934 family protein n=1 Tax=Clostridium transplantifaecale TaxID=2479838 RepID=UPI000F62CB8A|nr:DUF1934 family protein [Clostridium transplantifaecale]
MKNDVKKVSIEIVSVINGEENHWQTTGEYRLDGDTHLLAYTDYASNAITKNGLYAGKESMLLHRTGGITGDMLFDLRNATITKYAVFSVETDFVIQTDDYKVNTTEDGLEIYVRYTLTDKNDARPIYGAQRIFITML